KVADAETAGDFVKDGAVVVAGRPTDRLRGRSDQPRRKFHACVGRSRRGRFIRADWLADLDIHRPGGLARRWQRIGLQRLATELGGVQRSNLVADLSERRSPPCDERYEQLRRRQRLVKPRRARRNDYSADGSRYTHLDRVERRRRL